ncbi:hypothetical protein HPB52_018480 [Rhipicephalus sanguineus]|uniref:Uncharacterized protein n=1 Tax=Rhipicephalus sanguineus TaxID=34632 RepID=A0A9D4TBC0_RHISA|nr:hypothetical protein HPB52_018480 [Rhipicephalus sanguineus]
MITHAYVRYKDDKHLAIGPVGHIKKFNPKEDFSAAFYTVKWTDPTGTCDYYRARILQVGGKHCPRFPDRPTKEPLTPWKVSVMRTCYKRRLEKQGFPESVVQTLMKRMNYYVGEKIADIDKMANR